MIEPNIPISPETPPLDIDIELPPEDLGANVTPMDDGGVTVDFGSPDEDLAPRRSMPPIWQRSWTRVIFGCFPRISFPPSRTM
jgi:hypothetical protein